jgi:hypothetical protein
VKKSVVETNMYYVSNGDNLLLRVLCVDDLIMTINYDELIHWLKNELCPEFEMKDFGPLYSFLGLYV